MVLDHFWKKNKVRKGNPLYKLFFLNLNREQSYKKQKYMEFYALHFLLFFGILKHYEISEKNMIFGKKFRIAEQEQKIALFLTDCKTIQYT